MRPDSLVSLSYDLDADDRIVAVSPGWDWFAGANGAPDLTAEAVLGRSLLDFITGLELQQLTRHLLAGLRQRPRQVQLPFRCDSPHLERHLMMRLEAQEGGGIRIVTITLREQVRPLSRPPLDLTGESPNTLTLCAWCNRYALPDGGWDELERALTRQRWFDDPRPPRLTHGLCGDCQDVISAVVEA